MQVDKLIFNEKNQEVVFKNNILKKERTQLVLVFGSRDLLKQPNWFDYIKSKYPYAQIASCSTEEVICANKIYENHLSITAISFESTIVKTACTTLSSYSTIEEAGSFLVSKLLQDDLVHILVFSDGKLINGSELVRGMNQEAPPGVIITGGLASDGAKHFETLIGLNNTPTSGTVLAVGFYGTHLSVGHGSRGGWDHFGPKRLVTKSTGNILYELDGQNALDLYKNYLGENSKNLPNSALLFPLGLHRSLHEEMIIRTVIDINENDSSMIFAGDVPEGSMVQLMKTNFNHLIDGASDAASLSLNTLNGQQPDLAILISCIGRKLVLNQQTEDELDAVKEILGNETIYTGFYSHGEISPLTEKNGSELHNQSMTITTYYEHPSNE